MPWQNVGGVQLGGMTEGRCAFLVMECNGSEHILGDFCIYIYTHCIYCKFIVNIYIFLHCIYCKYIYIYIFIDV